MKFSVVSSQKHTFAIFVKTLSFLIGNIKEGSIFSITDEVIFNRIKNVLRLAQGDQCIFFDRFISVHCTIKDFIGKKTLCYVGEKFFQNKRIQPEITFLLPLLKRDDYEQALYILTEIGVTAIQLVFTEKSRHVWSAEKDMERSERIIISAAEQSKNYSYPLLKPPILLSLALTQTASMKVFFDSMGQSITDVIQLISHQRQNNILLLIGPEGDLTIQEKEELLKQQFIFCSLTLTILRSVQAASLGAGLFRSLLR